MEVARRRSHVYAAARAVEARRTSARPTRRTPARRSLVQPSSPQMPQRPITRVTAMPIAKPKDLPTLRRELTSCLGHRPWSFLVAPRIRSRRCTTRRPVYGRPHSSRIFSDPSLAVCSISTMTRVHRHLLEWRSQRHPGRAVRRRDLVGLRQDRRDIRVLRQGRLRRPHRWCRDVYEAPLRITPKAVHVSGNWVTWRPSRTPS
jgi:hypothetical protein